MELETSHDALATGLRARTQFAMLRTSLKKVLPTPDDNPFAELLRALDLAGSC